MVAASCEYRPASAFYIRSKGSSLSLPPFEKYLLKIIFSVVMTETPNDSGECMPLSGIASHCNPSLLPKLKFKNIDGERSQMIVYVMGGALLF